MNFFMDIIKHMQGSSKNGQRKNCYKRKSLAELFPLGMEKCSKIENPNLAVRFLLKMGDASMTAALGIGVFQIPAA